MKKTAKLATKGKSVPAKRAKSSASSTNRQSEPVLFTIEQGIEPPGRTYAQTLLMQQQLDKIVPKLKVSNSFVVLTRQKATVYKYLKVTWEGLEFRSTPTDKTRKFTRIWRVK
jgi:hypothetical protein